MGFYSFELDSKVLGDEPLLSISNRPVEEDEGNRHDTSSPVADDSQTLSQWVLNATSGDLEMSNLSKERCEETDLEKELLNQQCGELREELAMKDRDLKVLQEEVIQSAEELEEARSRLVSYFVHLCIISSICAVLM